MIYRLSNRLRKEAFVRARLMRVALPISSGDDLTKAKTDPVALAGRMLADVDQDDIRAASLGVVVVDPLRGRAERPIDMTGLLGSIVQPGHEMLGTLLLRVQALIVTIGPARSRHEPGPVQWPQDGIIDGVALLVE